MIAVVIDHAGGEPSLASLEVLAAARGLGEPVAVWIGTKPTEAGLATLGAHGATEVRAVDPGEGATLPSVVAACLDAAATGCDVILGVSTFAAKEAVTRFAVATGAGVVVDANRVERVGDTVVATQTVFAATWVVRTELLARPAVVLLRPNSGAAEPVAGSGSASLKTIDPPAIAPLETLESRTEEEPDGVPLAEAAVVVAGGRGTGGDFALVRELASVLGGAVGATRDATDEGWIGHEHMVGQTGTTVSPSLYVACGISGAIHHRGGMQGSGTIVAVNVDADAPIFEIADFGVVGTLEDVLPAANAALRERAGGPGQSA